MEICQRTILAADCPALQEFPAIKGVLVEHYFVNILPNVKPAVALSLVERLPPP
jgi:hypothetical protein